MSLQSELEEVAARGLEVSITCTTVKPDERMMSKGFGDVTVRYTVRIGKVDEEPHIAATCFNEPLQVLRDAVARLEK